MKQRQFRINSQAITQIPEISKRQSTSDKTKQSNPGGSPQTNDVRDPKSLFNGPTPVTNSKSFAPEWIIQTHINNSAQQTFDSFNADFDHQRKPIQLSKRDAAIDVSSLLEHVRPLYLADGSVEQELKWRLSEATCKGIKPECYYTREWFARAFDGDKSLVLFKLQVPIAKIQKHLEKTFPAEMSMKIMAGLDFVGDGHIYYKAFIKRLKSKLIFVKPDQILKFCFDVFDANNNRSICMQDMTTFSNTFAGVCVELMHDYLDISRVLLQKSCVYQN